MGLWVNGTPITPPNGDTSRVLLGVDLQKMKAPQQMLGVAVVREVLALDNGFQTSSTTIMLIPKNSWKSSASIDPELT